MSFNPNQTGFSVPNILQHIMALSQKNGMQMNNSTQQNTPTGGVQQNSMGSQLADVSALSQLIGYKPNTMFGYDLGGSGPGSVPNQQDIMSMVGLGQSPQQQIPQQAKMPNQQQPDFWSKLWGMFSSPSSSGGNQ